jgi:hypothetical protein
MLVLDREDAMVQHITWVRITSVYRWGPLAQQMWIVGGWSDYLGTHLQEIENKLYRLLGERKVMKIEIGRRYILWCMRNADRYTWKQNIQHVSGSVICWRWKSSRTSVLPRKGDAYDLHAGAAHFVIHLDMNYIHDYSAFVTNSWRIVPCDAFSLWRVFTLKKLFNMAPTLYVTVLFATACEIIAETLRCRASLSWLQVTAHRCS